MACGQQTHQFMQHFIFLQSSIISQKIKKELVKKVKEAGEKSNFLEEIRKKYPNAYRPWNEEQDKDLKNDFSDGLSIAKISKKHGRKSGAIKMRLIKFGLIEED